MAGHVTTTVAGTEEGRALFQRRLSIFGRAVFILGAVSWVALSLAYLAHPASAFEPFSIAGCTHLGGSLILAGLWLGTRGRPLSGQVLHAADVGVSLLLMVVFNVGSSLLPDATSSGFVALLTFQLVVLARAIVVPSTARRTLLLGLAGALVVMGFVVFRSKPDELLGNVVSKSCWAASAIAIATLASHTIFGLRREAAQARVLGQYTLEEKLGSGGMGDVWRASHALLRRPTAVKLLQADRTGEEALQRFERVVQLTARLTHPNTVAIYDYGRTRDGIFYYAMELIDGTDLEQLVAVDGPQPPERVIHILTQMCGALAEAHDLGVVHRDIKPANILLSLRPHEHEFVKVVDFGLVKTIRAKDSPPESRAKPAVTAPNALTGTPLFMSPEAILDSDQVDARSDLYQVGALGWFLLAGRPPFEGKSIVEVCSHHLHTAPERPSTALGRSLPSDLEDTLLACLAKKPNARPENARALRQRLEACALERWTAGQAAEWWRTRADRLQTTGHPSAPTQTLALDLAGRLPFTATRED